MNPRNTRRTHSGLLVKQLTVTSGPSRSFPREPAQRLGDFAIAGVVLILTLPLMVFVALAIRCESRGPIFSREARSGLGGQRFLALKFRTTVVDDQNGWARRERLTGVGRFLRYTRIDELPQVINVLRGELTMIGVGEGMFYPSEPGV